MSEELKEGATGKILKAKSSTEHALAEIGKSISGEYAPLRTRYEHFNEISFGGIARQKIITIGGLSSFGKSHVLRTIETDIFDEDLNPGSRENVVLVKCDFEMTKQEYILAKVKELTGASYKTLLYDSPTEEIRKAFNKVRKELSSDYIYETFDTFSPDAFYEEVKPLLDKLKHKKQIVLTIDNGNLIEGEDENKTMSRFMRHLISLKRSYLNLSIILLAQLNRNLKERVNPKEHFPRTTDFYHSSKIEHGSDIQIIVHNPYLLGYLEYGAVNYERYSYLSKYLKKKNKHAVFNTKGLFFFHYVKVRMKDDLRTFKDVFIEEIFEVSQDDTELKDENDLMMEDAPDLDFENFINPLED